MKKTIIFTFILLANLVLVSAIAYPHAFHGLINVDDGSNPNGLTLLGKIEGIATGSCIISDGKYDLVIIDNVGDGGEIEFYIGEEKADESASFVIFEIIELNLTFDTIPSDLGDCGNDVCDENECSSCAIDCEISDCIGNERCDIEIGESCLTAPEDCACSSGYSCVNGVCQKEESSSSSSSGGGNGGSPIQQDSITNSSDGQNDILSIESLNEADKEGETGSGITGAIIGFTGSGTGTVLIFVLLVILLGIGVVLLKKRSSKNE